MDIIKNRLRRLQYKFSHGALSVSNVILVVAIVLCLYWTWSAISSMSRNWELERRLMTRRSELSKLQLEVETLELENEFYKTDEYRELAARRQQGLMLAGETMVALPENSLTAKNKHAPADDDEVIDTRSNFEQWMAFLFGA